MPDTTAAAPAALRPDRAERLALLGLRVVLAAAAVGVLVGLIEVVVWQPSAPMPEPVECTDPPCFGDGSLPGLRMLPMLLPPLGYLLASALGGVALLLSLLARRPRWVLLLAAVGPLLVLVLMEVVPHLLNPCLLAAALGELPTGCSRSVHGIDVADRLHQLHHAVVGGVPTALAYRALLRRRLSRKGRPQSGDLRH